MQDRTVFLMFHSLKESQQQLAEAAHLQAHALFATSTTFSQTELSQATNAILLVASTPIMQHAANAILIATTAMAVHSVNALSAQPQPLKS